MHIDKKKAIRQQYRIRESVLLLIALCGGSIGCYCGMMVFRHKTKKPLFFIGLPVILSIQILLAVILFALIL